MSNPIENNKTPTESVSAASQAPARRFERNTGKIRSKRGGRDNDKKRDQDQFEHKIIHIRRVNKMFKGGRRMKLSVFVVVGDKKGKVGLGLGKGDDVRSAQEKAISAAKKNLIMVPLKGNTIPHEVLQKFRASRVLIKPAAPGTGIVAGSSMRMVAEVAGINDMLGKILGSNNKISNAYATVYALNSLRSSRL
jgi:small subunit ribosomal protein S5